MTRRSSLLAWLLLASLSSGVQVTLRTPKITEPIFHDEQHFPLIYRKRSTNRWNATCLANVINPDIQVDVSGYPGDDTSRRIRADPDHWHMCVLPSVASVSVGGVTSGSSSCASSSPVCARLLGGEISRFAAGCCSSFGEGPRSLGLTLDVWFEYRREEGAVNDDDDDADDGDRGGGGAAAVIDGDCSSFEQHSRQRFNFDVLPKRVGHRSFDDAERGGDGEEGGGGGDGDATFSITLPSMIRAVPSNGGAHPHANPATPEAAAAAAAAAAPLESISGLRRDGMRFHEYYRLAKAHAHHHDRDSALINTEEERTAAADATMDEILSHLAEPRLCINDGKNVSSEPGTQQRRLARIVVVGDSHAGIFDGAGGHYHGYVSEAYFGRSSSTSSRSTSSSTGSSDGWCSPPSNYHTSFVPSATAHGLSNPHSITGAAATLREGILQTASLLLPSLRPPETPSLLEIITARADAEGGNGDGGTNERRRQYPNGSATKATEAAAAAAAAAAITRQLDYVVVSMGEVDVRSVAGLRGVEMLEQVQTSTGRLFAWVERVLVRELGFRMGQVILLGAAPTCPDAKPDRDRGDALAKLRFNDELRRRCRKSGCLMADPSDDLVDYATGKVHRFFWSEPLEMHCSLRKYFFYHRAVKEAAGGQLDWCHQ